jgi:glycosyltransferase involved in cell wall biosynthesis
MHLVNGEYYAFNSVVSELDVFVKLFDTITWIGFDHSDELLDGTLLKMEYPNVKMILKPRSGGSSLKAKLNIFYHLFGYLKTILQEARKADVVHSRGPSGPMFLALIISFIYKKPVWWFKYANNWNDNQAPFFWSLQRKMMIRNKASFGTVNGNWPNMPKHILPFENPCLASAPAKSQIENNKVYKPKWRLLFVGSIEEKKGYGFVLDSLESIPHDYLEKITFIGQGKETKRLIERIKNHPMSNRIVFLGAQSKEEVFKAMLDSHFLLLPTTSSEGFPKVIAEAWSKGCLPIVSDMSSIGQYVQHKKNGFVWNRDEAKDYSEILNESLSLEEHQYNGMVTLGANQCELFTYEYYCLRIKEKILNYNLTK